MMIAGEKNIATPTPKRNLITISRGRLGAKAPKTFDKAMRPSPPITRSFAFQRVAAYEAGIWKHPAPIRNADSSMPRLGREAEKSCATWYRPGESVNQLME